MLFFSCCRSPINALTNTEYGGSCENRMRFPLEIFDAVRVAFPADKPSRRACFRNGLGRGLLEYRRYDCLRNRDEEARRRLGRCIVGWRVAVAKDITLEPGYQVSFALAVARGGGTRCDCLRAAAVLGGRSRASRSICSATSLSVNGKTPPKLSDDAAGVYNINLCVAFHTLAREEEEERDVFEAAAFFACAPSMGAHSWVQVPAINWSQRMKRSATAKG
ncbi:NADH:flavin oxidoreductase, Old Yellow Enzyme family [Candidatus Burkholderia pumila]|uniref:NADH:flavin oxidoreductase, Old Yellow Enzyme family n=1 Tax=Candidatus Burkholderia pumila TaxID=1090375 RepID=A0ABR5HL94_9BURK|nr:NADH:flavin oxidoreductase, Old Yellow Enzyme family [Candidatus Burkholderia pumila]